MTFFLEKTFSVIERTKNFLRRVLFYDHWMIGIIDQPIAHALTWQAAPPIRWIAPFDKAYYFADPFPWPGSDNRILCEIYTMKTRLGRIAALELDANGVSVSVDAQFPIEGHLSFPFLFLHENIVYALPESSASRRLEILRWDEENALWHRQAVVFDDLPVADAALFKKDGLFWISYTDITHNTYDNLHLAYASDLAGPWTPHPLNPVRRGRESSRNGGGVFEVNGKLYRPAQDCSRCYGGALRIMEITEWTTSSYGEREVAHITPSSSSYPDGIHTLVAWGDKCLVDGMRMSFSPFLLWDKIKRRIGLS